MLYLVRVLGRPWLKFGWTETSIWMRLALGLWGVKHPVGCCNSLDWGNLELIGLWEGGRPEEVMVQNAVQVPVEHGEFWEESSLPSLLAALSSLQQLPLPPRPSAPPDVDRQVERLPCCGGHTFICTDCGEQFRRRNHWLQHQETHDAPAFTCPECGLQFRRKGNLKRHARVHEP